MPKIFATLRARLSAYELVAFVAGFVLMAYELLASRLLAPSIGSSMYVWTSVIGVMIAALAIGYATGGWLADKRVATQDIAWLLLASALAITYTLFMYEPLLLFISNTVADQRLQGVLAATFLFMPASFLLGMMSPYLARLRVKSLTTTGRSVASLSALNSVGGISGTFCTGFILFSVFGSREALGLLVVVLAACSWLIEPRHRLPWRVAFMLYIAAILCLQYGMQAHGGTVVATIETPTSHYSVLAAKQQGRGTRLLATEAGSFQSGIFTDGSKDLVFDYTKKMAQAVQAAPIKKHIAIIGGGAFTLPEYLATQYPDSQIDVIEIDPRLPSIAQHYFDYNPQPNIVVYTQDARAFLRHALSAHYDIVLVDAYNADAAIPFALATTEYTEQLKPVLAPHGVVIANIIGSTSKQCMPMLTSLHASYTHSFSSSRLVPLVADTHLTQNIIGVYATDSLDWASSLGAAIGIDVSHTTLLTDNHAPVEALWQQCREAMI